MTNIKDDISLFDTWTEHDEVQAIHNIQKSNSVRHIIKDGQFWALTPSKKIYKLPIELTIADFTKLSTATDDVDQFRQLKAILTAFAGEEQASQLEHEPILVAFAILQEYGETIAKMQGVDLGKSQASAS